LAHAGLTNRDAAALEKALSVFAGDLLPGDVYEPWAQPSRDELRTLHELVRLRLGAMYLAAGRHDPAIEQYRGVLAQDPLC
jgi:hypothetical protein